MYLVVKCTRVVLHQRVVLETHLARWVKRDHQRQLTNNSCCTTNSRKAGNRHSLKTMAAHRTTARVQAR